MPRYSDESRTKQKFDFRIRSTELDRIRRAAARAGVTPSEFCRSVLSAHLDRLGIDQPNQQRAA